MVLFGAITGARGQFAGGSGTAADPYQVATADHLDRVRDFRSAHFLQTADIDLGTAPWNEGEGWVPIGSGSAPFIGRYDGAGYSVLNLSIARPDAEEQGLFGWLEQGSTVKNLGVENAAVTGADLVGALAGFCRGSVVACFSTGQVAGAEFVGGLVGANWYGSVSASYSTALVTGVAYVGGLAGTYSSGGFHRSFWEVDATGQAGSGGGKGLSAAQMRTLAVFRDANWGSDGWAMADGQIPRLQREGSGLPDIPVPEPVPLAGSGTAGDPFLVGSPAEFALLSWHHGILEANLRLTGDIDLASVALHPIGDLGPFVGVFDGAGFSVWNAELLFPGRNEVGLFGHIGVGGLVVGLGVEQAQVEGYWYVGTVAGHVAGTVAGCHASGSVEGEWYVGGLGGITLGSIMAAYSTASVSGDSYVGGLVGLLWYGSVASAFSAGPVEGEGETGGLVGYAGNSTVTASYWDLEAAGQATSAAGMGRTTEAMTHPHAGDTYVGWDFDQTWSVDEDYTQNDGYPFLRVGAVVPVTITVAADPADGGEVSGAGVFARGITVTVSAVSAPGFTFGDWSDAGGVLAISRTYSFVAEADLDLVARFEPSVLGPAVNAEDLTWSTGGDAEWFAQDTVSHDGVSAAQSGSIGDDGQSWMETTVVGPGRISFWWKVSSEEGYDWLLFYVNGTLKDYISGEADWHRRTFNVPPGSHTLRWMYSKDEIDLDPVGADCGWVDRVVWTPGPLRTRMDFDGDGTSDLGVYFAPGGNWYVFRSMAGFWQTQFGFSGTIPVVGDFDGDGRADLGCYHPPTGMWYLFQSTEGFRQTQFGFAGTIPVVGDFDGDGRDDFGCYHPPTGMWYLFQSTGGFWQTQFGFSGTIPVVGDFDGDGRDDFGCYHPPSGGWYVFQSTAGFWQTQFGYAGTVPVVGDFDGDGRADLGVYYAPGGNWYVFGSQRGFFTDQFGYEGTVPLGGPPVIP